MFNRTAFQDALAKVIKSCTDNILAKVPSVPVKLQGYDYNGLEVPRPRIVMNVRPVQFFNNPSYDCEYVEVDAKYGQQTIWQQYTLSVDLMCIGSPEDDYAQTILQNLRGKLMANYDLLFADNGIEAKLNNISDIADISVELGTKIEDRWTMTLNLHGCTDVYDDKIVRILEVNPQIKEG